MRQSAYSLITKVIADHWRDTPPYRRELRLTITETGATIGRAYTVTRNALNRLAREGKVTRRSVGGFYIYTAQRPEPVQ